MPITSDESKKPSNSESIFYFHRSFETYFWRRSCSVPPPPNKSECYQIPGTHFSLRLSWHQDHSAAGRIRSIEKFNDLIRNWTHNLLACSIVPQSTMLLRAHI
jgi:hypothetical protein